MAMIATIDTAPIEAAAGHPSSFIDIEELLMKEQMLFLICCLHSGKNPSFFSGFSMSFVVSFMSFPIYYPFFSVIPKAAVPLSESKECGEFDLKLLHHYAQVIVQILQLLQVDQLLEYY